MLEERESLFVGPLHDFVELIQLHKDAGIGLIKMKGTLHQLHGFLLQPLFVVGCKCQTTPHGGELRVALRREFPIFDSQIILTLVVVEASEVEGRTSILLVKRDGRLQYADILQTIWKTACGV